MSNPAYVKVDPAIWAKEGVRVADEVDLAGLDLVSQGKIWTFLDAMEWPQLVVFGYDGSDRLVAPFVVGLSLVKNPLMRGYQIKGGSRSGKEKAWKVFQMRKMENPQTSWDFFNPKDFNFQESHPWIYKVFKMLEGG